jgi:hypothetical protein
VTFLQHVKDRPELAPARVSVLGHLSATLHGASCMWLVPSGGEVHGMLSVASVACANVASFDEAVLGLWKLALCVGEEWEYTPWSEETEQRVIDHDYRREHTRWMSSQTGDPKEMLSYLHTVAQNTVEAQHTLKQPLNPPTYVPDAQSVSCVQLELLDYLRGPSLRLVLNNAWNEVTCVFEHRQRYFLVEWGTNA